MLLKRVRDVNVVSPISSRFLPFLVLLKRARVLREWESASFVSTLLSATQTSRKAHIRDIASCRFYPS